MFAQDVGPVHLRVEDRAALAAGAGDDVDVDALGDVPRGRRRALARLVVGVGVHVHQPEPGAGPGCGGHAAWAHRRMRRIWAVTSQDRPRRPVRRARARGGAGALVGWPACVVAAGLPRLAGLDRVVHGHARGESPTWSASTSSTSTRATRPVDVRLADDDVARDLPAAGLRRGPHGRRASCSFTAASARPAASVRSAPSARPPRSSCSAAPHRASRARADLRDRGAELLASCSDCPAGPSELARRVCACARPDVRPVEHGRHSTRTRSAKATAVPRIDQEYTMTQSDRAGHDLADPGRLRQAPGRARRPQGPPAPGDHRADQRRPRRGRPQGERRLPRRQGRAGQAARPGSASSRTCSAAPRSARPRADDGVVEPGMVVTYRFAGDDDTEKFLLGAREIEREDDARGLLPAVGARRRDHRQVQGRHRRPTPLPTARSSRSRSSTRSPTPADDPPTRRRWAAPAESAQMGHTPGPSAPTRLHFRGDLRRSATRRPGSRARAGGPSPARRAARRGSPAAAAPPPRRGAGTGEIRSCTTSSTLAPAGADLGRAAGPGRRGRSGMQTRRLR